MKQQTQHKTYRSEATTVTTTPHQQSIKHAYNIHRVLLFHRFQNFSNLNSNPNLKCPWYRNGMQNHYQIMSAVDIRLPISWENNGGGRAVVISFYPLNLQPFRLINIWSVNWNLWLVFHRYLTWRLFFENYVFLWFWTDVLRHRYCTYILETTL